MKKRHKPAVVWGMILMIIILLFLARPVLWSVVSCIDSVAEGKAPADAWGKFPVHMKKYTIKFYEDMISDKILMNIITDESEDDEVRSVAISAMPSDEESIEFLKQAFWKVDEDISYRILKRLWVAGSAVAEEIADEILAYYESYSPEKICAALIARKEELLRNNRGRTEDELINEKNNFVKICEDIKNNYDKINKIDRQSDDYKPAFDPVVIAVSSIDEMNP